MSELQGIFQILNFLENIVHMSIFSRLTGLKVSLDSLSLPSKIKESENKKKRKWENYNTYSKKSNLYI